MDLDLTASTRSLGTAATDLVRLLPGRLSDPVLAGMVIDADADGVTLAGTDRERGIRLARPARTHGEGRVLVPARLFADTLRGIDTDEVRLAVEGRRLAVRTPGARFALPLLDLDAHPGVRPAPQAAGELDAALLPTASVVAQAASRDDALPVFTGVHVRHDGERLVLVGTDRFRMAVARVPWQPATTELDVLILAGLVVELAKQASGVVSLHADADRVGFSFAGSEVTTALLAASFPDESRHLAPEVDCTLDLEADELAGAVRRVAHYAGPQGAVVLEVGDSDVRVRAGDPAFGDAEEAVKATVTGDRFAPAYQPRYLTDALHAFTGRAIRIGLRTGVRRSSVISAPDPDPIGADLHYVLMPKRA